MSRSYDGAGVVITGGASGIGRSIAAEFGRLGARVLIADIDAESAEATARELGELVGRPVLHHCVDVADESDVLGLADRAFAELGRVDVLCNNAGISWRPFRAIWNSSAADYRKFMDVNFFGVLHGVQAFLPRMRLQDGHKHIVNTSSSATLLTTAGHGPYTASKEAIEGLSKVLRAELIDQGEDFGVTILWPGLIETNLGITSERAHPATGSDAAVVAYERVHYSPSPQDEMKGPDLVGAQVVEAIRNNDLFCLTHPTPVDALSEWREAWFAGYRGM